MRIILRENIENLGAMGDVVEVKNGYARNYLIPKELAYVATDKAVNLVEQEKQEYLVKVAKEKEAAEAMSEKFNELQVTIAMKVGDEGKLFGSVTTQMVAKELELLGYEIDKKDIVIPDAIKTLGVFTINVKLHPEVTAQLKVWVISEE